MDNSVPNFLWILFKKLKNYRFHLTLEDLDVLRLALFAGFGWESQFALRELCCTLWAKSREEQDVVRSLFDQLIRDEQVELEEWEFLSKIDNVQQKESVIDDELEEPLEPIEEVEQEEETEIKQIGGLPGIYLEIPKRPFVFMPQYQVSRREVIQSFRRLRKPIRSGPAIELDIDSTIEKYSRDGVATEVVLVPRRINAAKLIVFVEKNESMTPFQDFVDFVVLSIEKASRLDQVSIYFFNKVPVKDIDFDIVEELSSELMPQVDRLLSEIKPINSGIVYSKNDEHLQLSHVLEEQAKKSSIMIISDAGAAITGYNIIHLVQTFSFLKALNKYSQNVVWINPLGKKYWTGKLASEISRHVPMFPLNPDGIFFAINVLKGQPYFVDIPL